MIQAIIAAATIVGILIISEILWHTSHLKGEFARKFVHIVAGTYIAFLPFVLSYNWILLFGIGFVLINILNRYTKIFNSFHAIRRKSFGDVMFGLSVIVCAYIAPSNWVFMAAILHVSLADGLAAIVGSRYGKKSYKILGHKKTLVGTSTFILSSLIIFLFALYGGELTLAYSVLPLLLVGPFVTAAVENISGYGTDNLTLPLTVLLLFSLKQL